MLVVAPTGSGKTLAAFLSASDRLAGHPGGGSPEVKEGDFTVKDFKFASGETLPELRLHYRTLGTPSGTPAAAPGTPC